MSCPPAPHRPTTGQRSTSEQRFTSEPRERLGAIARILESAHHTSEGSGASLVRLAGLDEPTDRHQPREGDIRLALLPVPDGDVLSPLLGSTIPAEWEAVGVVVEGSARALEGSTVGPRIGRVRTAVIVARDGCTAGVLRREGEEPVCTVTGPDERGPAGRIPDALRRAVGRSTRPPEAPLARAVAQVWLHRVHALALAGDRLDTSIVDALRPAAPASWSALREQCAANAWPELACAPELATWMDDGFFSRWCLAGFPEPVEVLAELRELTGDSVVDHLARALASGDRSEQ